MTSIVNFWSARFPLFWVFSFKSSWTSCNFKENCFKFDSGVLEFGQSLLTKVLIRNPKLFRKVCLRVFEQKSPEYKNFEEPRDCVLADILIQYLRNICSSSLTPFMTVPRSFFCSHSPLYTCIAFASSLWLFISSWSLVTETLEMRSVSSLPFESIFVMPLALQDRPCRVCVYFSMKFVWGYDLTKGMIESLTSAFCIWALISNNRTRGKKRLLLGLFC